MSRETVWEGDRGEGTIFYRHDKPGGPRVSANLYIGYRAEGKPIVVSAKTDDFDDAKRERLRLIRNRDNATEGLETLRTPKAERVTIADILDANLRRATEGKLASLRGMGYLTETLKSLLGSVRALQFRPEHVDRYVAARRAGRGTKRGTPASDATIHRELEILSAAFRFAVRRRVLAFAPWVQMPAVDNVSSLEFPPERIPELLAGLRARDEALADLVEFMSLTARRPLGLRRLTWDLFDARTWTLTIPPEKKGNAVLIGLTGSLRAIIERRIQARRLGCDLVFHRDGRAMNEQTDRRIFEAVVAELELPYGRQGGFTIYTVKSTAIGLMHDAGLSNAEIKDRSGHKTDSQMERYLKQRPERAHAASAKLEEYLAGQRAASAAEKSDKGRSDGDSLAVFPRNSEK